MKMMLENRNPAPEATGNGISHSTKVTQDTENTITADIKKQACNKGEDTSLNSSLEGIEDTSCWVLWKNEHGHNGKDKKVPYSPQGTRAKVNDEQTWSSYADVSEALNNNKEFDGLGFVLSEKDNLCVIDLDNCRNPDTGEIEKQAEEIICNINSFTEISPSGKGVHIWLLIDKAAIPQDWRKRNEHIEIYWKDRYITITGNHLNTTPRAVEYRHEQLVQLHSKFFPEKSKPCQIPTMQISSEIDEISDKEVLTKALRSKNGTKFGELFYGGKHNYPSPSEADLALCNMLAYQANNNVGQIDRLFRNSQLFRGKWDEQRGLQTYGEMTINKAITGNCLVENPSPQLDPSALYGLAGKFVELACKNSEASPVAVLITFLARFAAEAGSEIFYNVGDTKHYARIFAVLVGDSSKSRKGTSAGPVKRLFEGISKIRTSPGPLSSGEGLIAAVEDNNKANPSKCLFILDSEFGSALDCGKRDGNILSTVIRNFWDDGKAEPLTKYNKISATKAHLGIVTHITNYELNLKLGKTEPLNGFANRFLWVHTSRAGIVAKPVLIPKENLEIIQTKIEQILLKMENYNEITMGNEATEIWHQVYPALSDDHPGLTGCIINRAEAQVTRLAMIYCLLDAESIISKNHLMAALALWKYCEASANYIFHSWGSNPDLNKIIDALKTGSKTTTELHNVFGNHKNKVQLGNLLEDLIKEGRVVKSKILTTGAPQYIYELKND